MSKRQIPYVLLALNLIILWHSSAYGFVIKGTDKILDAPAYKIRGTEYLPLTLICDAYGIDWKWDSVSKIADLSKGNANLRLKVGEYKVYTNGVINVEERPVVFHKGAVCIPSDFLRTIFNKFFVMEKEQKPSVAPAPAPGYYKIKRIVLDAGHGGYDPGAIGRHGLKEKYIVLDIMKKIKDLLESEGIEVILTRHNDRFIPLWDRVEIANCAKADLFISIHANASRTKRLKGFEIYYLSEAIDDEEKAMAVAKNSALKFDKGSIYEHTDVLDAILWDLELTEGRRNSIELANCILGEVDSRTERLKAARFYVLKGVVMPAILIEVGYITNVDEYLKLSDMKCKMEIAGQIAKGIMDYKKKFEDSDGFTR